MTKKDDSTAERERALVSLARRMIASLYSYDQRLADHYEAQLTKTQGAQDAKG